MSKKIEISLPVLSSDSPLTSMHRDLTEVGIDYVIIGGVALGIYNYQRYTEDIDILVSKKSFPNLENLVGRGYIYNESDKCLYLLLKDNRIRIDIVLEGDNFGIILPNPKKVRQKIAGIWVVNLPTLITLKLLSGRNKDLQDVLQLIKENNLDLRFANKLKEPASTLFKEVFEVA